MQQRKGLRSGLLCVAAVVLFGIAAGVFLILGYLFMRLLWLNVRDAHVMQHVRMSSFADIFRNT